MLKGMTLNRSNQYEFGLNKFKEIQISYYLITSSFAGKAEVFHKESTGPSRRFGQRRNIISLISDEYSLFVLVCSLLVCEKYHQNTLKPSHLNHLTHLLWFKFIFFLKKLFKPVYSFYFCLF